LNLPLALHHSITSSARASKVGGISRPSALAKRRSAFACRTRPFQQVTWKSPIFFACDPLKTRSAGSALTFGRQSRPHRGARSPDEARRRLVGGAERGNPFLLIVGASGSGKSSADLLVMGSYSTGPLREEIFGGCTRSILNHAPVPVFVL
jgi:hypothetical protein